MPNVQINGRLRRLYLPNVLGLALIQGLNLVFPVVLIPVIFVVQGVEAYGQYATTVAYYFFASLFCDYGFDYSAVRALKRTEDALARSAIIANTFAAKWLISLFAIPLAAVALFVFANIRDLSLIAAGALIPLTSVLSVHWIYLADRTVSRLVIPVGSTRLVSLIALLAIYPEWPSVTLVMVLATAPIFAIQMAFFTREMSLLKQSPRFSIEGALSVLRSGAGSFYVTFITSYISMSPVLAVSLLCTAKDVGMFAAVDRIIKAGFGLGKPFLVALYPEMTSLFHESKAIWLRILRRVILIALCVGIVAFTMVYLLWDFASIVLFGEAIPGSKWIAYGLSAWLTLGLVNNAIGIQGLLASGHDAVYARAASAAALILTLAYAGFGKPWGALGIVYAILISELTFLLLNARALKTAVARC